MQVVEKFFGELATLGFIGTIAFVLTTGFAGHESVGAAVVDGRDWWEGVWKGWACKWGRFAGRRV